MMIEGAKYKRRWFQFSLRSLFVLVAICSMGMAWVGKEVRIVHERLAMIKRAENYSGEVWYAFDWERKDYVDPAGIESFDRREKFPISWIRWLLGDMAVVIMVVPDSDVARAHELFPEAEINPN